MSDRPVTNPVSAGSQYTASRLNENLAILEEAIENCLGRGGTSENPNSMQGDLDMNNYKIINTDTDANNPTSLLNVGEADNRYINTDGDTMQGPIHVKEPLVGTEPAQKMQLDAERSQRKSADSSITNGYMAADANIQAQLTGKVPLEASAFSPISWHDQSIDNSVVIPENKNAWSFGPAMIISPGASVTVSEGSAWTIANGEVNV